MTQRVFPIRGNGTTIRWTGTIRSRVWYGDFPEDDYKRLFSSGVGPDSQTLFGVPVYYKTLNDYKKAQEDLDHECDEVFHTMNVACNAGRTNILNYIGNTVDQGVRYFSVGTGPGTPSATDTAMFADYYRQVPTGVTLAGNILLFSTFFSTSVANTTYTEAGLIGGSTAVGTVGGAGTLFAHASYAYTKTASVTLTNDYSIALS